MKSCAQHQAHSPHPMHSHQSHHAHHHHGHGASFPSPSTPSLHGVAGPSTCCSAPGAPYAGSHTLPANYNGQADANGYCYRTRTLPMGPYVLSPNPEQQWLTVSPRAIGLFALSLVFILIWSTVISSVLVNHSLKEHQIARHTFELFQTHRDVSLLAFEVGQEMLFTLNASMYSLDQLLLSSGNTSTNAPEDLNTNTTETLSRIDLASIHAKWNKTNLLLQQLSGRLVAKGYLDFESDVQGQLENLRSKCVQQVTTQWPSVGPLNGTALLYPLLTDCVRTFEQSFHTLDSILMKDTPAWLSEHHSKLTMTDLFIRDIPYTLFVRGMVHRFTSLGLGLLLVRSNFTQPFNMSEYFHFYFSSRQLIESSFVWNYRFLQKYLELDRTDYQADMLLAFFDSRRTQENEFYEKMSSIFSRFFSLETLNRIRIYIKKKNVETVERLLVNGSRTKYQDANVLSIQLNTDLIEAMGLENIEQVMFNHQQMLFLPQASNLNTKYDHLLKNQIGFMSRVQDFLNISLSSHLTQSSLNEDRSLLYHSVLSAILFLSVFFCLALFLCSYCCFRVPPGCSHASGAANAKSNLSRRMRRRLWNLSSPFSLFKSCFSSPFSSPTSPPRYPLLYKSSHNMQTPNSPSHQMSAQNRGACPAYGCSSPSNNLLITTGKRGTCVGGTGGGGGSFARYPGSPIVGQSGSTSNGTKSGVTSYKATRYQGTTARQTETTSLMNEQQQPSSSIPRGVSQAPSSTNSSCMCCIGSCPVDPVLCDSEDQNGCPKCALATGKCSGCEFETQKNEKNSKEEKRINGSLHSSAQSLVLADSKNSTKSTTKNSEKRLEVKNNRKVENEYVDT